MTTKNILILINSIALICSLIWFILNPDWEPLVTSLGLIGALITQICINKSRNNKSVNQVIKNNSSGIQAGRDVNINSNNGDKKNV